MKAPLAPQQKIYCGAVQKVNSYFLVNYQLGLALFCCSLGGAGSSTSAGGGF